MNKKQIFAPLICLILVSGCKSLFHTNETVGTPSGESNFVITSYSIHYTKLYELMLFGIMMVCVKTFMGIRISWRLLLLANHLKTKQIVITSYSIHYTKLYD